MGIPRIAELDVPMNYADSVSHQDERPVEGSRIAHHDAAFLRILVSGPTFQPFRYTRRQKRYQRYITTAQSRVLAQHRDAPVTRVEP